MKKKKGENKNTIKFLLKYFKEYKIQIIIISIIILLVNMSSILSGYLVGQGIESVTYMHIKKSLIFFLIYFLSTVTIEIISRISYYCLSKIQIKISRKISFEMYQKVLALPAYAFEELSSGQIINRVSNDTEVIVGSIDNVISMFSRIISAIFILIYICANSWLLGVEILCFLGIYALIVKVFSKKLKEINKKEKEINDKYSSITTETIRGVREVRTLGIKNNLFSNVKEIIKKLYNVNIEEYQYGRDYDIVSHTLRTIVECTVFVTCAIEVYFGHITLAFFIAMTYYVYNYTWLIENINYFSKQYEKMKVATERIREILENTLYKDVKYGNKVLDNPKGVVTFKNVTFNYKHESTILKDFNITFEPNKKIAIVGSSGEGKTTLFNLLTRIFDPISGSIYLDDVEIRDLTEESLNKNISIIRQEPFIFNRTIYENFKLLDNNIKIDEVRKYCKMASIDDYIMSLPKKYNTLLGEGGVNLSGGQKQRMAIARTLLKKSKVILLDEATSALDNESQDYIKKSIDALAKDHTVIIVAHRLSTIIDADIIYLIKDGKIEMSGNHETLLKKSKYYQKLYSIEGKTI